MSFFSSRWVDAPAHVCELDPTTLPAGFRAAGVAAGLKPSGLDVGVLFCESPDAVSAARFTTNARVGAPVIVSRASALDRLRAVVANSGCSNVGDGERGLETARAMQREAAEALAIEPAQVGVASTGVIGRALPREKVLAGIRACATGAVTPLREGNTGAGADALTAIAVCTSTAALSMSRLRSNWSVTFVPPVELDDVISSTPAIVVNCRSSGLATADAIVPGSPPGSPALTFSVGKSTFGRSLTGSARYAMTPNTAIPSMMRLVAIGRWMKTVETFTGVYPID